MSQTIPHPLQIISTGDEDESCLFVLNEENLNQIIAKVPPNMKVGILAVVGAFRTGKSFLLNLFLRYLRHGQSDDATQKWMSYEGEELLEGNMNEGGWSLVDEKSPDGRITPSNLLADQKERMFAWRGGQQRQTTGIWMWSEPFIRRTEDSNGEEIAILLMDTQGMFDNETTMTLTAQIFGLSTLVSSFQIYNVDKRIQEDNLQHLALFSEYGRMALLPQNEQSKQLESLRDKKAVEEALHSSSVSSSSDAQKEENKEKEEQEESQEGKKQKKEEDLKEKQSNEQVEGEQTAAEAKKKPAESEEQQQLSSSRKPFQRLQFLVRDWQNFDTEYHEGDSQEILEKCLAEMQHYLDTVLKPRNASDLQSTRDQIIRCFDRLDCFLLPHPGFEVTKKTYDGAISRISPDFRALLNRYCRLIFDQELQAKMISNRFITALELKNFFEVYVKMFQLGAKQFPKAMTMLEATAEANNRNAFDLGMKSYKDSMSALVGSEHPFVKEMELTEKHHEFHKQSLTIFNEIATMGSETAIENYRQQLLTTIDNEKQRYFEVNALKNPYRDMEYYILPMCIAFISYVLAKVVDKSCSSDFCESVEDTLDNIYLFIFFIMIVLCWQQIRTIWGYVKELLPFLIANNTGGAGGGSAGSIDQALKSFAAAKKKSSSSS